MAGIDDLRLSLTLPAEDVGPLEPEMQPITTGHSVSYAEIPLAGEWTVEVTGRPSKFEELRGDLHGPHRRVRSAVGSPGPIRRLLVESMDAQVEVVGVPKHAWIIWLVMGILSVVIGIWLILSPEAAIATLAHPAGDRAVPQRDLGAGHRG